MSTRTRTKSSPKALPKLALTYGEKVYVNRRRAGLTQEQFAAHHDVPLRTLREWETLAERPRRALTFPVSPGLEPHETCHLLRRRRGWTVDELAGKMGRSRSWVMLMEQGRAPVRRLSNYWLTRV